MKDRILFVDDDANILEGFKRQLRSQFYTATALRGEEGLELLRNEEPFAAVVSDMRMPGMNGAQFLAKVREGAPDSVRIMLTGHTDIVSAIAAVNEGNIFRFLTKPCPPDVMIKTLQAAVTQYKLITSERTLLEQTLRGSVKVLMDVLALVNPLAFGQTARLKRYVHHIVTHLDLPDLWQYELATMLCHIGCVTLPVEVLEKVYADQPLSPEEQKMFGDHPKVGHDLLQHIPRLETVAAIVAKQNEPGDIYRADPDPRKRNPVTLGAQLLKIALDFDKLIARGRSQRLAVGELLQHPEVYDAVLVTPLKNLEAGAVDIRSRYVGVRDLVPGMILGEDVMTKTGTIVLAKGHEVNYAMMQLIRRFAAKGTIVEPFRVLIPHHKTSSSKESFKIPHSPLAS